MKQKNVLLKWLLFLGLFLTTAYLKAQCLNLPTNNGNWNNVNRVTYDGNWLLNSAGTAYVSTPNRSAIAPTTSNNIDFGVNDFSSDVNFNTPSLPFTGTIIRVGKKFKQPGQGLLSPVRRASVATFTFSPTNNNCKIRVYYIGALQETSNQSDLYSKIIAKYRKDPNNQSASFGLFCKYNYSSTIPNNSTSSEAGKTEYGTVTTTNNITFTNDDANVSYGLNDMFSFHQYGTNLDTTPSGFNKIMTAWKSYDMDFSEFIGGTVTITLFANTSNILGFTQNHSYCYYHFECLSNPTSVIPSSNLSISNQEQNPTIINLNCLTENPIKDVKIVTNNPTLLGNISDLTLMKSVNNSVAFNWLNIIRTPSTESTLYNSNFASVELKLKQGTNWDTFNQVTQSGNKSIKLDLTGITASTISGNNYSYNFKVIYNTRNNTQQIGYFNIIFSILEPLLCNDDPSNFSITDPDGIITQDNGNYFFCESNSTQHATLSLPDSNYCSSQFPMINSIQGQTYFSGYLWQKKAKDSNKWENISNSNFTYLADVESYIISDKCATEFRRVNVTSINCTSNDKVNSFSDSQNIFTIWNQKYSKITKSSKIQINHDSQNITSNSLPKKITLCYNDSIIFSNIKIKVGDDNCSIPPLLSGTKFWNATISYESSPGQFTQLATIIDQNFTNTNSSSYTIPNFTFNAINGNGFNFSGVSNSVIVPINLTVTTNIYGCTNTTTDTFSELQIFPRAIGGGILAENCPVKVVNDTNQLTVAYNSNEGNNSLPPDAYIWSYCTNYITAPSPTNFTCTGNWVTIPGQGDQELPLAIASILNIQRPFIIKRTAKSGNNCGGLEDTSPIEITNIPQTTPNFTLPSTLCIGNAPNPMPVANPIVNGNWYEYSIFIDNTTSPPTNVPIIGNTPITDITLATTAGQHNYIFIPATPNLNNNTCYDFVKWSTTISKAITPTFTIANNLCSYTTPPLLPAVSENHILGIWSPSVISTTTTGVQTYTFTPSLGQCANVTSMDITINNSVVPTFTALGPYCKNATPETLPLTSNNGITGTWSPATISTSTVGTKTYTFTPNSGQCTNVTTINITITNSVVPTFTALGPYCKNATPGTLPLTSNNGVTGTWSPATISTSTVGTQTYTFTPSLGQCANVTSMYITVNENIIPTFDSIGSICSGTSAQSLPALSTNNIAGTWSPGNINSAIIGSSSYTFTPISGGCHTQSTLSINVIQTTIPTFNPVGPICNGHTAPILPTTSINGIAGTWSPAIVDIFNSATYTFTPSITCSNPISMPITVLNDCIIGLSWGSEVSCEIGENNDPNHSVKDYDANIADGPCIRVCENSKIKYTLAGTGIATINHTVWNVTGGTIDDTLTTNTVCFVTWGSSSYCALQGTIYLNDGTTIEINKCIEKLAAPSAMFGILPLSSSYSECVNVPIYFTNLSSNNDGNDVLYYNWDFGDGTTSNEFQPSHTYTDIGEYTVNLVVFNGCSCSSKFSIKVKILKSKVEIKCTGVVCEGSQATYNIDPEIGEQCNDLHWEIVGGHQINSTNNNTQITVQWDDVDSSGYGYLSAIANSCFQCNTPERIPVVTQHGSITGNQYMCSKNQATFALPQWPSTVFNWTIDDGGTGAFLIMNNNRNEIIVNSASKGTLQLYCTYFNTLLGCGGNAHLTIFVKPYARLNNLSKVCQNNSINYQIKDENNNTIPNINWTIDGPDSFSTSGTTGDFNVILPNVGIYNFTINDPHYCTELAQINVVPAPNAPATINGSTTVCPGIPEHYSCAPLPNAVAHWQIDHGTILGSANGNNVTISFDANPNFTEYHITVRYIGELCDSNPLNVTIHRDIPNFNIDATNITVCGSTTQTYSTTYSQGENYIWTIQPEKAGSIQSGQNTKQCSILWNQAATPLDHAVVTLSIRKCGKVFSQNFNVNIINRPEINITGPSTICADYLYNPQFTMSVGTSYNSVTWDFGNQDQLTLLQSQGQSPNYLYTQAQYPSANYTVTATVHGGNGCPQDAVALTTVTVSSLPVIDLNLPDTYNICNNHNSSEPKYIASVNIQSGFAFTFSVNWHKINSFGIDTIVHNGTFFNVSEVTSCEPKVKYYAVVTNEFNCSSTTKIFEIFDCCSSGGGPGDSYIDPVVTSCNDCNADFNVTNTCGSVTASIFNPTCTIVNAQWSCLKMNTIQNLVGTVTQNTSTNFVINELTPGKYHLTYSATTTSSNNGIPCGIGKSNIFIIPYVADIRTEIHCDQNNLYHVTIFDHSVYYPYTPITKYEYKIDGGAWIDQNTATSYSTTLPIGTHVVGVRISAIGYASCEAFMTIILPNFPSANFTHAPYTCQNEAMQFNASDLSPALQYNWNFPGNVLNIDPNPVRMFANAGPNQVTLTVTNLFGCAMQSSQFVEVKSVKLGGTLNKQPDAACEGGQIQLNYVPIATTFQVMPSQFTWYLNKVTIPAQAQTSIPYETVNVSGQYFVYVKDSFGCNYYENNPVSVAFTPLPEAPVITGNATACLGNSIHLSVPNDTTMHYTWSVNNVVNHDWDNQTEIYDSANNLGAVFYSVVAQVGIPSMPNTLCSSPAGSYTVNVIPAPDEPQLNTIVESCIPYRVRISVLNPQQGINYYWSNGATGTETVLTHDGPIEVRAESLDCVTKVQTDTPRDLSALGWTFPNGCFTFCKEQLQGYIVGPLGIFDQWQWLQNGNSILENTHSTIAELHHLEDGSSYQLNLDNGNCNTKLGTANITSTDCNHCKVEFKVQKVKCFTINGVHLYSVTCQGYQNSGLDTTINLSVPNGEGVFENSTISLPSGTPVTQTLLFYTLNNFVGGNVLISLTSLFDGHPCYNNMVVEFPEDCKEIKECNFKYGIEKILCIKTNHGNIYEMIINIDNPYEISATTTISVPNGEGYCITATLNLPALSSSTFHVNFYPLNGFSGGPVTLFVNSGFGTFNCRKKISVVFPDLCDDLKNCHFKTKFDKPLCQFVDLQHAIYNVSFTLNNNMGPGTTINLTAPNAEGYFVPNHLTLPLAGITTQTVHFYPYPGLNGGTVVIAMIVQNGDESCYTEEEVKFDKCCLTCSNEEGILKMAVNPKEQLLLIAPNPAKEITTIFYNFVNDSTVKKIEVIDLLGRTMQSWTPTSLKGEIEFDCKPYANGQYLILMKENDAIIERTKLITN